MEPRPTLARRLVAWFAPTVAALLAALGFALDRAIERPLLDQLPLSIVDSRMARVRLAIVAGSALAALIAVAVVWLLARRLIRPVGRMSEAVSRMSVGDLSLRLPTARTAELGRLAETLNGLAEGLDARIRRVEGDRRMRESILAAMDEGVVLVEQERIAYVNPAARRLLGGVPAELRALAPPALQRLVGEVAGAGEVRTHEVETGVPSRVVRVTGVPVPGRGRVLIVLRDVTEQRRVEAMRRDFVADASHELKTPAASIQAAAETLRRAADEDPRAVGRFAEQLHGDALRLSRLVADLLDLSRLETRPPDLGPVRLDLLAGEEAERAGDRARGAGVRLVRRLAEARVEGDEEDLRLLIANLLDNAIRFTGPGGEVRLEVGRQDGRTTLVVGDTGVGIPSRDLPRIFERFYRVDRARSRETGGTGLGLSIARHVAEQHGGRIEVESELGRGSIFRVSLPQG